MSIRIGLTLDCADAVRAAEFWKLALGYEDNPPPAPYTSIQEWLTALGEPDTSPQDGAWLRDPAGLGPSLSILRVPEPKGGQEPAAHRHPRARRVRGEHWAVVTAKVAELTSAGATTLREDPEHHVVMADPEGNEFCVC